MVKAANNELLAYEVEAINLLNQAMSGRYDFAKEQLRKLVRRLYLRDKKQLDAQLETAA